MTWCASSNSLAFRCVTAAELKTTRGGPVLNPFPTLDELAAHPERASEIPPATAGAHLARLV
jgi:hypothetical protein